jgi:hypothetical protein
MALWQRVVVSAIVGSLDEAKELEATTTIDITPEAKDGELVEESVTM